MSMLADFRGWVAGLLQDPAGLIYEADHLDAAVRMALREYGLARGIVETIQGLDGAVATSVTGIEEGVIVLGAAGYAAAGRVARRAEAFSLGQSVPTGLVKWASDRLERFGELLEVIRLGRLRAADAPAWSPTGWRLDEWDARATRDAER
ncbi:MAG: hypothetical protein PHQ40_19540 [Anaerolineaceae bacterium]|nr:hypothetical protein [Anaerolineaceae bacterium]